jgi:hypothetical protein
MRVPTLGPATVFAAATLAVTATSPGPAEAFILPLPFFQSQPFDARQGRSPTDNRWRNDTLRPVKPSIDATSRDDDGKSSSKSANKGARSATKSETKAKSDQDAAQTSRSRSAKHEPPPSKRSGRASTTAQRANPGGGSASTAAQEASPDSSRPTILAQETSSSAGSNVGDIFEEKLGEVFQARIDELLKQPPR